jgi:two-component system, LytTR family, response regulator
MSPSNHEATEEGNFVDARGLQIRTVVIDDERIAREKLRLLLESEPDIHVVAECRDGARGLEELSKEKPDLIFLDIQMPDLDGFDLLSRLPQDRAPIVVFTTAYDQYAVRAFEARALDYLLKPFDKERLRATLERARLELRRRNECELTSRVLARLSAGNPESRSERLIIKTQGRVIFLDFEQIDWVEAEANYVRINAGQESYVIRGSIGRVSEQLRDRNFVRIHRSTLVNISRIKELQPVNSAEYVVILRSGKELSCSRGYRGGLQRLIEENSLLQSGITQDPSPEECSPLRVPYSGQKEQRC